MKTVLLIEPDMLLAESYKSGIEALGFDDIKVILASNAQEAIRIIDNELISLIVMEVQLAGHNGIELIYEIRSYPEWKKIPIMINTFLNAKNLPVNFKSSDKLNVIRLFSKSQTTLHNLVDEIEQVLSD